MRSIGAKILTGYGLIALLVAVVGALGLATIGRLSSEFDALSTETLPVVESLKDLRFAGLRVASAASEFALVHSLGEPAAAEPTKPDQTRERDEASDGSTVLRERLATYRKYVLRYFPEE